MENSIYVGLSQQMALKTNMDFIANNIANMSTSGYRGQHMLFEEYIADPLGGDDELSMVYNRGQYQDTTQGSLQRTENPLDIALEGPGYIGVQAPNGQIAYTRAGEFQLSAEGTLVNSNGRPIADAGGASITIPPGSREIKIDEKGFVSNEDGQLGQIMVVEFENIQTLEPYGHNMYLNKDQGQLATNTRVKQGQLEGSNVQPIMEMTQMVETLRTYQSITRTLQSENDRLRTAIQKLTGG